MSSHLEAGISEDPEGHVVVRLAGELDAAAIEEARRALDEALALEPRRLAIDLGALEFMDSTGIWLVVDTHRRCVEARIDLRLEGEQRPAVANALALSGVDDLVRPQGTAEPNGQPVSLRLYVSNGSSAGAALERSLRALSRRLADAIELEVIDVFSEPQRAQADRVIATPTLIRVAPAPELRLIGAVADPGVVLRHLALEHLAL